MGISNQLLELAKKSFPSGRGRNPEVVYRRIISHCYYSVFHLLTERGCHIVFGATRNDDFGWRVASRAVEHSKAKEVCKELMKTSLKSAYAKTFTLPLPQEIVGFCSNLVELQSLRHKADYDQSTTIKAQAARDALDIAQRAHRHWNHLENNERQILSRFVLCILFKDKLDYL